MNPARRRTLRRLAGATALGLWWQRIGHARVVDSAPDVVFLEPSDPEFARHRTIFNKRFTETPRVIAACRTESGAVKAVRYANRLGLPIAVKSGGHSLEGFSLNEGGMVIDLSAMNALTLDSDHRLRAEPGCRLAQVSDYLLPRGRLLPAGTCGGVGLAGLTLGGGYGFFSRSFGLTCDSLRRVRMVDGDGRIRDSRDEPRLLWACRGGGNGALGVITQMEYVTHVAPEVLQSFRYRYRVGSKEEAFAVTSKWAGLMQPLPPQAYSALTANSRSITILVTTFSQGAPDGPLAEILAMLAESASRVEQPRREPLQIALRAYVGQKGPLYFKNASGGFYHRVEDVRPALATIFEAVLTEPGIIFQINTFGPLPAAPESAFAHRQFAFIGELQSYWDKPQQQARAMDTIARLQRSLTESGVDAHYANYPDINLGNWAHAYYGRENYTELQALKRLYDPANAFRYPQSIRLPD